MTVSVARVVEESAPVKYAVAAICAYETTAILTGRTPTITALHRRHHTLGVFIVSALAWHFRTPKEH